LRRQVPSRSISQIIQILEWEGLAEPGQIKRSTLQEKLAERGYSARHMKLYAESGTAARRYQKKYRNQLWHSDLKYGPYLPIGQDGRKKQVYLVITYSSYRRTKIFKCTTLIWFCPFSRYWVIGNFGFSTTSLFIFPTAKLWLIFKLLWQVHVLCFQLLHLLVFY
jgi:hypothetical protein